MQTDVNGVSQCQKDARITKHLRTVAKRVEVVKAADVFDEREIELIRRTVRPVVKGCYRNAHLLTLLFPDRVQYVEGKTNAFIPIDHAFNRVGDKYIDITFEFALG